MAGTIIYCSQCDDTLALNDVQCHNDMQMALTEAGWSAEDHCEEGTEYKYRCPIHSENEEDGTLKRYIATYRKGSGGISENEERIIITTSIYRVFEIIIHDLAMGVIDEDETRKRFLDNHYEDQDMVVLGGEFEDNISKGGDWMYFDLLINRDPLYELEEKVRETVSEERLDEFVHDIKSEEASVINNAGLDSQIEYLAAEGGQAFLEKILSEAA